MITALPRLAIGHEFWLDPAAYQVEKGERVQVSMRNGEAFEGFELAYFSTRSTRFDQVMGDGLEAIEARPGDLPAFDRVVDQSGLLILAHETAAASITYKEWEKFAAFAKHKDFPDITARHEARGLARDGFSESYTRHVKTLVGVGDARGADRALGLRTEFVALANPYTDDLTALPVQLLLDGAPRVDAQVEIFDRAPDGTVTITLQRTDDDGQTTIPVTQGHSYLLDAVVLAEASEEDKAVWSTFWAALTFAIP
ncbi:MAG: DUF4198 domain-containing protein [Rhodobacteraceae bacterium]|nr:DUF4198 domain-containing protein [Paracoccaceae bacterium]